MNVSIHELHEFHSPFGGVLFVAPGGVNTEPGVWNEKMETVRGRIYDNAKIYFRTEGLERRNGLEVDVRPIIATSTGTVWI